MNIISSKESLDLLQTWYSNATVIRLGLVELTSGFKARLRGKITSLSNNSVYIGTDQLDYIIIPLEGATFGFNNWSGVDEKGVLGADSKYTQSLSIGLPPIFQISLYQFDEDEENS